MKVGIIGATGNAGRAVYVEAVKRGHEVTAIVRNRTKARAVLGGDVVMLHRDAFALERRELARFEVIVNAFSTAAPQAYRHVDLAVRLADLLRETTSPRVVFILGCGSLVTGADRHLVLEDLRHTPGAAAWISIPESQLRELRFLQRIYDVNWVGISPSKTFTAGDASGVVLGGDELLIAPDGSSRVSTGTMAVAILDEIERPAHRRQRFTVRDA